MHLGHWTNIIEQGLQEIYINIWQNLHYYFLTKLMHKINQINSCAIESGRKYISENKTEKGGGRGGGVVCVQNAANISFRNISHLDSNMSSSTNEVRMRERKKHFFKQRSCFYGSLCSSVYRQVCLSVHLSVANAQLVAFCP